jgi:hypothetical protein
LPSYGDFGGFVRMYHSMGRLGYGETVVFTRRLTLTIVLWYHTNRDSVDHLSLCGEKLACYNSGKPKPDTVRATTCCMVLVRLLGSKSCFDAIRNLPEIGTVLFQVFS